MAETVIENLICQTCGANVRPQSLFCYNCGKSVAPEIVQDLPSKKTVSGESFRENIAEPKENGGGESRQTIIQEIVEKPIPNPMVAEEPKLKSAAAMRRQSKSLPPKPVEVVWEEHENAPNGWFIFAAITLTLFAAVILYLTMFFK